MLQCLEKQERPMEVAVTSTQYSALSDIYGPPQDVYYMIMCSRLVDGTWLLSGDEEVFEELLGVISEEIGEGLCSKTNARALIGVCKKIDPSSLDWIGM